MVETNIEETKAQLEFRLRKEFRSTLIKNMCFCMVVGLIAGGAVTFLLALSGVI